MPSPCLLGRRHKPVAVPPKLDQHALNMYDQLIPRVQSYSIPTNGGHPANPTCKNVQFAALELPSSIPSRAIYTNHSSLFALGMFYSSPSSP